MTTKARAMGIALSVFIACACTPDPETACDDGKDNDKDGLVDCQDPDCADVCDSGEGDTDTEFVDGDGDGFEAIASGGDDCDDGDASTFPGAAENESETACMTDKDGDGYGEATPASGVEAGTDCRDDDAAFYQGSITTHQGIDMVLVCPGSFQMGAPEHEPGRDDDEVQHQVTLETPYLIGRYEVTQAQFDDLMGYQPSWFAGCEDCPSENFTWSEAAALTNELSALDGLAACYDCDGTQAEATCTLGSAWVSPYDCPGYRLPTEAEWEYAARGGSTSTYSNGGDLEEGDEAECSSVVLLTDGTALDSLSWYCFNASNETQPVGTRSINPLGLHDIHGNIHEWCHDFYGAYASGAVTNPWGVDEADTRVLRSGSWKDQPSTLRTAQRGYWDPADPSNAIGLRLARSAAP